MAYDVLIVDPVGFATSPDGSAAITEVQAHIEAADAIFVQGDLPSERSSATCRFIYRPDLSRKEDILREVEGSRYDAIIAAATIVPEEARFPMGGVRIGSGTGNMRSRSWGGADGCGGEAPLMNTPGINARATAQMVLKALLSVRPDLPLDGLHRDVLARRFDTGRDLSSFPTRKLEGQAMAVLGFGNIGREVARLAAAFGMVVTVFARERHRRSIESEGFGYAGDVLSAVRGADVLSIHLGLGATMPDGASQNAGLIDAPLLAALKRGAVLLNYDRAELVHVRALDLALRSGGLSFAAIDGDVFLDAAGQPFGPLAPFLAVADAHSGRMLLTPHVAADTDHPTRVAGAKLAVDLVLNRLRGNRVRNLVGDLPPGLANDGTWQPPGVGRVLPERLRAIAQDTFAREHLVADLKLLTSFYSGLTDKAGSDTFVITSAAVDAILAGNRVSIALERHGLRGPSSADKG